MERNEASAPSRVKECLKNYLTENNLTQRELAEKLNTTEASVSRYVSGARTPSFETLVKIAKIIGISLDDLVRDAPGSG